MIAALDYAQRGLNMYGGTSVLDTRSDVVGGTLYHEERGYGDQLLFPDPDTAALVPWADRTGRFICDARWYDGTPLAATPRLAAYPLVLLFLGFYLPAERRRLRRLLPILGR